MGKLSCLNFPVTINGMDGQTLGESIRVAREAADMSQGALAKAVGASLRAVGGWERGEVTPTGRNLARLREVLPAWTEPPARGSAQMPRIRWEDEPVTLEELIYLVQNAELVLSRALEGGLPVVVDRAKSGALMGAVISARHLLDQAVHGLRDRSASVKQVIGHIEMEEIDAQAPQQIEETGRTTGGRGGGGASSGRAPIDRPIPSAESMDELRRLNGEDTGQSRDDPKSG